MTELSNVENAYQTGIIEGMRRERESAAQSPAVAPPEEAGLSKEEHEEVALWTKGSVEVSKAATAKAVAYCQAHHLNLEETGYLIQRIEDSKQQLAAKDAEFALLQEKAQIAVTTMDDALDRLEQDELTDTAQLARELAAQQQYTADLEAKIETIAHGDWNEEGAQRVATEALEAYRAALDAEVDCHCGGTPSRGGLNGHPFSDSCTCCRDTCNGSGKVPASQVAG